MTTGDSVLIKTIWPTIVELRARAAAEASQNPEAGAYTMALIGYRSLAKVIGETTALVCAVDSGYELTVLIDWFGDAIKEIEGILANPPSELLDEHPEYIPKARSDVRKWKTLLALSDVINRAAKEITTICSAVSAGEQTQGDDQVG